MICYDGNPFRMMGNPNLLCDIILGKSFFILVLVKPPNLYHVMN